jgi:putative transposase
MNRARWNESPPVRKPGEGGLDLRRSRFAEEQIIRVLRGAHAGEKAGEVCRCHGTCEKTPYRWKAKYTGMRASDVR